MYQIIYASTATHLMSEQELTDILTKARANNEQLGVTGMLLYNSGNFLQVLEGDEANVNAIYNKISQDDRHYNLTKIFSKPIASREFGEWSMGFRSWSDESIQTIPGYSQFLNRIPQADEFGQNPGIAHDLLLLFREHMR